MSKKPYIDENPVLQYLTKEKETPEIPIQVKEISLRQAPEARTRRRHLLMQPSLHTAIEEEAKRLGTSVNDLIHQILEAYISEVKR